MPLQIPEGFALVKVLLQQGSTGLEESNGFGLELNTPLDQSSVDDLSTDLAAAYKPILSTGSNYIGVHILEGTSSAPLVWDSAVGTGAGTRVISNQATPQVQLLLLKRTVLAGRKFRGRTFLPDVAETDMGANGVVVAGTITLMSTYAAAVFAALSNVADASFNGMHLLHSDATTPTPVTQFVASNKVATLRHRYPR